MVPSDNESYKEKKRVKIRWKITTASFALRNFISSLPAMTIMKEKDWQEEWYERKKKNKWFSFLQGNKQQKQSFEKEES